MCFCKIRRTTRKITEFFKILTLKTFSLHSVWFGYIYPGFIFRAWTVSYIVISCFRYHMMYMALESSLTLWGWIPVNIWNSVIQKLAITCKHQIKLKAKHLDIKRGTANYHRHVDLHVSFWLNFNFWDCMNFQKT